jgi:hypothetical protein
MKLSSRSKALINGFSIFAGVSLAVGLVIAQSQSTYTPPDYLKPKVSSERDDVWFETNVGSFKLLSRGDTIPSGTLTMNFTGSVLVSELNGTITPEGNVRREYNNKERGKEVWFGTGKITITGSYRAVQWFGRNLKAHFNGNGFLRLYGEFDKQLETGSFWFDPNEKKFWGNFGTGFGVPEQQYGPKPDSVKTREEFEKGKGAG